MHLHKATLYICLSHIIEDTAYSIMLSLGTSATP